MKSKILSAKIINSSKLNENFQENENNTNRETSKPVNQMSSFQASLVEHLEKRCRSDGDKFNSFQIDDQRIIDSMKAMYAYNNSYSSNSTSLKDFTHPQMRINPSLTLNNFCNLNLMLKLS